MPDVSTVTGTEGISLDTGIGSMLGNGEDGTDDRGVCAFRVIRRSGRSSSLESKRNMS